MLTTLKTIDEKLVSSPYLCGAKMTIGDIVVYNEVSQFFEMTDLSVTHADVSGFDNLAKWFTTRMSVDPEIQKHDQEMKNALGKVKKTMPDN